MPFWDDVGAFLVPPWEALGPFWNVLEPSGGQDRPSPRGIRAVSLQKNSVKLIIGECFAGFSNEMLTTFSSYFYRPQHVVKSKPFIFCNIGEPLAPWHVKIWMVSYFLRTIPFSWNVKVLLPKLSIQLRNPKTRTAIGNRARHKLEPTLTWTSVSWNS